MKGIKKIVISYMEIPERVGGIIYKTSEIYIEEKDVLMTIMDIRERGHHINHGYKTKFIFPSAILGAEVEMTWEHLK
jgi:predicted transcriptional regulator